MALAHKSLYDRVADAFGGQESPDFTAKYFDYVLQASQNVEGALRRTIVSLVALAVAFQVTISAQTAQVSLGPLQLDEVSGISALISAVFAYLLYESWVLAWGASQYRDLRMLLLYRIQPKVVPNDLHRPLSPTTVSIWGADPWSEVRKRPPGKLQQLRLGLNYLVVFVVFVGAIAFLAYAYVRQFREGQEDLVALWASAVFAGLTLVRFLIAVLVDWRN